MYILGGLDQISFLSNNIGLVQNCTCNCKGLFLYMSDSDRFPIVCVFFLQLKMRKNCDLCCRQCGFNWTEWSESQLFWKYITTAENSVQVHFVQAIINGAAITDHSLSSFWVSVCAINGDLFTDPTVGDCNKLVRLKLGFKIINK